MRHHCLRRVLLCALAIAGLLIAGDAEAIVRGRPAGSIGRHVVLLVGPDFLCSATVIGRRDVLTAPHCVEDIASLHVSAGGRRIAVAARSWFGGATRLTLARDLPSRYAPIALDDVAVSGAVTIAGYGVSYESPRARSAGLREARLVSTGGRYGPLVDPKRHGAISASACMGDSGGPVAVYDGRRYHLVGIIDRASYPSSPRACGYYTIFIAVGGPLFGSFFAAQTPPQQSPPPRHSVRVRQKSKSH
jgi:Trypsin